MASFPTAAQARERGQNNRVIREEIFLIELNVLDAIANNLLTVDFGGSLSDSSASTTQVNGTTVTASEMTADNTGGGCYNVWKTTTTDATKTEAMAEVISYFANKGFTISRKSGNSTTFYWSLSW